MPTYFGEFALDSARRELRRRDRPVRISPMALGLLELLIARRDRVVPKAEIRSVLWPERQVSESCLARVATDLRGSLGDDARAPVFVRTVHGVGYAFLGECTTDPPRTRAPSCRLCWGNRRIPLFEGDNTLGRGLDTLVPIDSPRVSRRHARITVSAGRASLEDLGSRNGTFLGGRRLDRPVELRDGDEIGIGPVRFVFERKGRDLDTTKSDAAGRSSGVLRKS